MSQPYKYFAFISYSRKDSKVAAWLQKRLEWFRFPVKLVPEERRPPNPRYVRPIYRDKTNLPVTVESYWKDIRLALEESRFLIMLCSPHSAASKPVDMEVSHFLATHDQDTSHLVPIIVSGNVTSSGEDAAFCPTLRLLGESLIERTLPTMVPDGDTDELDGWEQGFVSLVSYLLSLDRTSLGDHIQRETKRQTTVRRRWFGGVTLLTLCSIAGVLYSFLQKREVQKQKDKQGNMQWSSSHADHESAIKAFAENRYSEGLTYLDRAVATQPMNHAVLASSAVHAFAFSAPAWQTRSLKVFESTAGPMSFSPDSEFVAVGLGDGSVRAFKNSTGEEAFRLELPEQVTSVCYSPDGKLLAAGGVGNSIVVYNTVTRSLIHSVTIDGPVSSMSFSPSGETLAIGTFRQLWGPNVHGSVWTVDANSGNTLNKVKNIGGVTSLTFSLNGQMLAIGAGGGLSNKLEVMSVPDGKELFTIPNLREINSIRFSPDGSRVAIATGDNFDGRDLGQLVVVETATRKMTIKNDLGRVNAAEFSPDGTMLAIGGLSKQEAIIYDMEALQIRSRVATHGKVRDLKFSPDCRWLAVAEQDNALRVYDVLFPARGEYKLVGEAKSKDIPMDLDFSPNGCWLAATSMDGSLRIFEALPTHELDSLAWDVPVTTAEFSHDGKLIGVGLTAEDEASGACVLVDALSGKELQRWNTNGEVFAVCFSQDDRMLIYGDGDSLHFIELADMKEAGVVEDMDGTVTSIELHPVGHSIAVGLENGGAGVLRLRDVSSINEHDVTFEDESQETCRSVAFSPDGKMLAIGYENGTTKIVDLATRKPLKTSDGMAKVWSVSFSAHGNLLAIAGGDSLGSGEVTIIQLDSWNTLVARKFRRHVRSVCFSPDGKWLLAGTESLDNEVESHLFVLDAQSGKDVGKIPFLGSVSSNCFAPSASQRFAATSFGGSLRVFDTGAISIQKLAQADQWHAALQTLAGPFSQTSHSHWHSLDGEDARTVSQDVSLDESVISWWQAAPIRRRSSPWSDECMNLTVGRWLIHGKLSFAGIALSESAPWHPLCPVALARIDGEQNDNKTHQPSWPHYLARLTLKRLREADEKLYGRDTLAEYAAWAAKIMHEELYLDAEAREALTFALERTPPGKQNALLELKAKINAK